MQPLSYTDRVFGHHLITEPVIVDLINGPSIQRLKEIDQAGYPEPFFPSLKKHTRFEHSLGVYLLLNLYKASLEEQIAGLIHDASHTAFSHCADYTLAGTDGGKTQSHQDNVFEEYVRASEIPAIIAKHSLNIDVILDDTRFPLKEQPLPDLCADRIDYSFRAALASDMRTPQEVQAIITKLSTNGQEWFFFDVPTAREYAELFSQLNSTLWCGINSAAMFKTVGDCLRYAYEQHYLSHDDLYGTDRSVIEMIRQHLSGDAHLQLLFERMNNTIPFVDTPSTPESVVYCKSRVVNPLCMHRGGLYRLSDLQPDWLQTLLAESRPKSYCIGFEDKN